MAEATTRQLVGRDRSAIVAGPPALGRWILAFYVAVVAVQGVHVVEHIIQLIQVYLLGVSENEALGLLGYVFAFQGTEEWLHIVFNVAYLITLVVIAWALVWYRVAGSVVPAPAMAAFLVFGVWLEGWHVIEHIVIISNVIANNGCPCPGILDAQLKVSDTILHFGYNAIAYAATVLPLAYVIRHARRSA